MSNIEIKKKPDWVTYDAIRELLYEAHKVNREKKGFTAFTSVMTGEQLEEHIGKTGKCFVAIDGEKLVGVCAYRRFYGYEWCIQQEVADRIIVGVHPDYRGMNVSTRLFEAVDYAVKEDGYTIIRSGTAEHNNLFQDICLKDGFVYVNFVTPKGFDHYSVIMYKWIDRCPYSRWKIHTWYLLKKIYLKFRFKEGRIKRFGI